MLLLANSLGHFLVDSLCLTTIFGAALEGQQLSLAVVLYNTLAFSTQCVVGLLIDRFRRSRLLNLLSMLTVALGFALPLPDMLRICIVGLGNSLFHVAAGTITLEQSGGRARDLGIFVAPGALGVAIGSAAPQFGRQLCVALLFCAVAAWLFPEKQQLPAQEAHISPQPERFPALAVVLLTCAVAVRAVGGSAVSFPWRSGAVAAFLMALAVFGGKFFGGFVCDRLGAGKTALLSIPLAALLIAFCYDYALPSLLGQLLLNLSMPVTLYLLYRAMPDAPGFSFGLAASALWPGTIAGMLFQLTGPARWLCVLASFLFGLFAILYSVKKLMLTERSCST